MVFGFVLVCSSHQMRKVDYHTLLYHVSSPRRVLKIATGLLSHIGSYLCDAAAECLFFRFQLSGRGIFAFLRMPQCSNDWWRFIHDLVTASFLQQTSVLYLKPPFC